MTDLVAEAIALCEELIALCDLDLEELRDNPANYRLTIIERAFKAQKINNVRNLSTTHLAEFEKHKPELILALDESYSIGVKCLSCKWFMASNPVLNETMLNDFDNEHADRQAITNRIGGK